jgi:hypothetical protein
MIISLYPTNANAIEHPDIGYCSNNGGILYFWRIYDAF